MSNPADPTAAPAGRVTPAGAAWLASASCFPRSVHALWALRPAAPSVLPCGTAFDVVSTGVLAGRRLLDRLWSAGPGSGPAAVHQGRLLLFAAAGTADRLPSLLGWEEWRDVHRSSAAGHVGRRGRAADSSARPDGARPDGGRGETIPPLLCHGRGDAVTVPPLQPGEGAPVSSRWLVAPDVRHPWLPGAETLLWACVRAGGAPRTTRRVSPAGRGGGGRRGTNFTFPGSPAKVYDVSRRR